jgi:hypothetical protein
VTSIIILPERDVEFEGGINCFEPNRQFPPAQPAQPVFATSRFLSPPPCVRASDASVCSLVLQQGDCVLFRGEQTEHWITPVSKGVRRFVAGFWFVVGVLGLVLGVEVCFDGFWF